MQLGNTPNWISKGKDGVWSYSFDNSPWERADEAQAPFVEEIYKVFRSARYSDDERMQTLRYNASIIKNGGVSPEGKSPISASEVQDIAEKIINFFSEFHFEPNFRFVNTFANISKDYSRDVRDYVECYFELADSPFTSSIVEKMKSHEFDSIVSEIKKIPDTKQINTRFKLYYGSQGTGKTTKAIEESDYVIVCHSALLPSDLMEDFEFVDGNATFKPSALQEAMINGKRIVLDEINLLPFESLRFLQSILDGKKEFTYKGKIIKIHDDFKIIGTMNLVVNGCVYSLPEPLIDRAEDLRKFKLTACNLVGALI